MVSGSSLTTDAPRVGHAPIKQLGYSRVLGEGGMAVVYEARDLGLLRYFSDAPRSHSCVRSACGNGSQAFGRRFLRATKWMVRPPL